MSSEEFWSEIKLVINGMSGIEKYSCFDTLLTKNSNFVQNFGPRYLSIIIEQQIFWSNLIMKLFHLFVAYFKTEFPQEGIFFVLQLFAWWILLIKKLEIEKTRPTFIISVLKVEIWVSLVFSISSFFINKLHQANNWSKF